MPGKEPRSPRRGRGVSAGPVKDPKGQPAITETVTTIAVPRAYAGEYRCHQRAFCPPRLIWIDDFKTFSTPLKQTRRGQEPGTRGGMFFDATMPMADHIAGTFRRSLLRPLSVAEGKKAPASNARSSRQGDPSHRAWPLTASRTRHQQRGEQLGRRVLRAGTPQSQKQARRLFAFSGSSQVLDIAHGGTAARLELPPITAEMAAVPRSRYSIRRARAHRRPLSLNDHIFQ